MADIKEITLNNSTYDIKAKSVVNQGGGSLKMWTGTQAEYDAITTKDATTLYNITDSSASMGSKDRVIGQIVHSILPLTDAGLHLLDGALIDGSGAYASFVQYIAGLVSSYPNLFVTEANWQASVTTYGVCGKFVYDNVNNTVRLPKVTGIIEGTTDVTALGDLVEAGLPNITGRLPGLRRMDTLHDASLMNKALHWQYGDYPQTSMTQSVTGNVDFDPILDASVENSIYGNSTTVQPQTIKAFIYIVIATSVKTDIQVDIDEVATDLNGKADTSLVNLNNTGKIAIVHNAMPSNTYDDLTLGASGTTYTAPADGRLTIHFSSDNGNTYFNLYCNNNEYALTLHSGNQVGFNQAGTVSVRKGTNVEFVYNGSPTVFYLRFIYAVGSESEAQ